MGSCCCGQQSKVWPGALSEEGAHQHTVIVLEYSKLGNSDGSSKRENGVGCVALFGVASCVIRRGLAEDSVGAAHLRVPWWIVPSVGARRGSCSE
jgi:hypothetical protein